MVKAKSVPASLANEFASTRDGRDITRGFTSGLQQPRDPRLLGSVDWGVYDQIEKDDQVFSTFQQRRGAVVSRDWNVVPGDENDPRSVEAAERFGETIKRIGWDRVTDKMLYAIMRGIAVAEIMWEARDGFLDFAAINVRHARRFRFMDDGALRLLTPSTAQGEPVPARKFWVLTMGGSDDDEYYGRGLAEWLYWPVTFKRNGLRFWNIFLDKFGSPTAVGKYRPGTTRGDIDKLLAALQAIATDSGIVIPEGAAIDLLQAAKSGTADYHTMAKYMDGSIAKIILSQTMTTDDGASLSQAKVHAGVKLEVVKSDADLNSDSFNGKNGPSRWWTDLNYGPDVAHPRLTRDVEEETDTKAQADTDVTLKSLGWERDEESFQGTYGDGYVRITLPRNGEGDREAVEGSPGDEQPLSLGVGTDQKPHSLGVGKGPKDKDTASFAADDPRPLYVYRTLLNADDLATWAHEQGFTSIMAPGDMHVTVAYSKKPVNWMAMGGMWGWNGDNAEHLLPPGGPRLVEQLGDATCLVFFSGHLQSRNREMRDAGASWDHDGYFPHISFSYDAGNIDLTKIEPYRGELRFGPEIFEPIEEDWRARVQSSFAESPLNPPPSGEGGRQSAGLGVEGPQPRSPASGKGIQEASPDDPTDALVDELIASAGYQAAHALTAPMLAVIKTANSAEELYALLDGAPGDESLLATSLENASFALTLDAEHQETNDD